MKKEISANNELSTNARYLIRLCKTIIKDVKDGRCSEEEMNEVIATTTPRKHGFIDPEDYLSAESAMKYLCIHRNKFFELTKQYNVKVHKINNMPIGYHINDIRKLKNL